jgi:hypothetical protein
MQCLAGEWRKKRNLEFTITVNWRRGDGSIAATQFGTHGGLEGGACRSAGRCEDVGLQLADSKRILGRLQEIVVSEQLQRYCEAMRPCPRNSGTGGCRSVLKYNDYLHLNRGFLSSSRERVYDLSAVRQELLVGLDVRQRSLCENKIFTPAS